MPRPRRALTLYPSPLGERELAVESLTKSFGARTVLDNLTFSIAAGELVAIVGSSGGGKTVLLDHLAALMAPTSGRVLACDHSSKDVPLVDLAKLNDEALDNIRLAWAIVFQRNALFSGTVFDNIALWLREHTDLTPAQVDHRIRGAIEAAALDVNDVIQKDRDSLSGGMAKRVAIARAIAVDPLVLFYDEPTTGLDPVISAHIHDLIWNVHHRPRGGKAPVQGVANRTSVVVTHDKELLRRIAPRVIMLDQGKIIFDGPYEAFTKCDHPVAIQYMQSMPVLHARN